MGSKQAKMPGPSAQEQQLQGMQLEMLKENRALMAEQTRIQDLLAPSFYKSAGLTPRYEGGKIVGFDQAVDDFGGLRKDIERGFLERTLKAQRGELALDPALERGIGENKRALEARLLQQLGPGYATSTPGMQALAQAGQGAEELRASSRRGELTLAEQLGLTREQANQQRQYAMSANLRSAGQIPGFDTAKSTNYLNSLSQALQGYQGQRQAQFQANALNAGQPSGLGTALGIGATLAGTAAGSFLGPLGAAAGGMAANALFRGGTGQGYFPGW
jgi:hypothetical protein